MSDGFRQEVLNVILAQILQERDIISVPESIIQLKLDKKIRMPDVIVNFCGLRSVIEGEIEHPSAEQKALTSAKTRVEESIAHIGIAVVYPGALKTTPFENIKDVMRDCEFKIAVITESEQTGFVNGNIEYLATALKKAFDGLLREDVVATAVAKIDAAIEGFAGAIDLRGLPIDRIADILGIRELPEKNIDKDFE